MQGRFRTGTVEVLKYNQDKRNNFAMLPQFFNPCLRDTLLAHLYYSTLHNFSVRQVTDSVTRGAWRLSRLSWAEGGVTSWPRCQFVTGPHTRDKQTATLTFTPTANSESPIKVYVFGLHSKNCCELTLATKPLCCPDRIMWCTFIPTFIFFTTKAIHSAVACLTVNS